MGITIEVFEEGKSIDRIVLNEAATGGISGSKLSPDDDELEVRIDYKGQRFVGVNGKQISGLLVTMLFEGRASNWALTKLEIENLGIEGSFISDDLSVVSSHGYRIAAPKGLAWCCQDAGLFSPPMNETTGERYTAGLRLPGLRLQVFEVVRGQFGPECECGESSPSGSSPASLSPLASPSSASGASPCSPTLIRWTASTTLRARVSMSQSRNSCRLRIHPCSPSDNC